MNNSHLILFLTNFYLLKIIDSPTHIHGNILDLIFCSTEDFWSFEIKSPVISDHYAIILKSEVEYVFKNRAVVFLRARSTQNC